MNRILYQNRCKCNEESSITKKRKSTTRSEGKPLQYPESDEVISKTFKIKLKKKIICNSKICFKQFS